MTKQETMEGQIDLEDFKIDRTQLHVSLFSFCKINIIP